jgi:hypothetical protein
MLNRSCFNVFHLNLTNGTKGANSGVPTPLLLRLCRKNRFQHDGLGESLCLIRGAKHLWFGRRCCKQLELHFWLVAAATWG